MLNDLQEEERDRAMLKDFRMALVQGKESIKMRSGWADYAAVKLMEGHLQ